MKVLSQYAIGCIVENDIKKRGYSKSMVNYEIREIYNRQGKIFYKLIYRETMNIQGRIVENVKYTTLGMVKTDPFYIK